METWAASFFSSDSDFYLEIPRTVPSTDLSVTAPHPLRVSENRFSSMSTPLSTTALGLEATRGTQWRFRNRKGQQGCRAARGAARGHRAGIPRRRRPEGQAEAAIFSPTTPRRPAAAEGRCPPAGPARAAVTVAPWPGQRGREVAAERGGQPGAGRAAGGGASSARAVLEGLRPRLPRCARPLRPPSSRRRRLPPGSVLQFRERRKCVCVARGRASTEQPRRAWQSGRVGVRRRRGRRRGARGGRLPGLRASRVGAGRPRAPGAESGGGEERTRWARGGAVGGR